MKNQTIIVNGKPIKISDIVKKMADDYKERNSLPDPDDDEDFFSEIERNPNETVYITK